MGFTKSQKRVVFAAHYPSKLYTDTSVYLYPLCILRICLWFKNRRMNRQNQKKIREKKLRTGGLTAVKFIIIAKIYFQNFLISREKF